MSTLRERLREIRTFPELVKFLRDELDWPIDSTADFEDLTFDFTPEELGIDPGAAAKIERIQRLRPLSPKQPWGIFFVKFEPKRLPVVALRRLLSQVALKKRASANSEERAAWAADDLLFISNYGEGDERQITFAHFSQSDRGHDLPTLKVLGWDNLDTPLHLDDVVENLTDHLVWPEDENDLERWRASWGSAFTLRHREVISSSRALSIRLAELARAIRDRIRTAISIETDEGPLTRLWGGFREALIHDLDPNGFSDMYAQTIAYGLLSARIAAPKRGVAHDLSEQMPMTNPFLKELMETFLRVGGRRGQSDEAGIDFDELGVSEIIELLDRTNMEAVVRDFGDRNPNEDPVIHFYELFLREYDPNQRMKRGVFYTPRPVVSYIVNSVHRSLRDQFGLPDGLADISTWGEVAGRREGIRIPDGALPGDHFVTILDPATGTGTFLVEVIDVVHQTLVAKWRRMGHSDGEIAHLWNTYVTEHLLPRVYGYELLMAPYAIAHLKLSLKLRETGYRFESDERARVYLTNTLEPPHDFSDRLEFAIPALAHEAEAVNEVKRTRHFTVVIGNPPYSKLSQNKGSWISSLMERYKTTIKTQEVQRQALSNDYVKFFCFSTWLLEHTGQYLLGMITDNSYLDGPLFRDMRSDLLSTFQEIHVVDVGGNLRKKRVLSQDENVFDIQQGVAIFVGAGGVEMSVPRYSRVVGTRENKYAWLLTYDRHDEVDLDPTAPSYLLLPTEASDYPEWDAGVSLPDLFAGGLRAGRPLPFNGAALATRHDEFAVAMTRAELEKKVDEFFDPALQRAELVTRFHLCQTSHFSLQAARAVGRERAKASIKRLLYRPFDERFVLYHPKLIGEPRPDVMGHLLMSNLALLTTRRVTSGEYDNVFVCKGLAEYKAATHDRNTQVFPLYLHAQGSASESSISLGLDEDVRRPNLDRTVYDDWRVALQLQSPEQLFQLIYAILYSPTYRARFSEKLHEDYARIPKPSTPGVALSLAQLGAGLIELHLVETRAQRALSAHYDAATGTWRYQGAEDPDASVSISFCGPEEPIVSRVTWSDDTVWLDGGTTRKGGPVASGTIGFKGIPEAVWNFHIGGYQVCQKWLKDRRGRVLSQEDIAHYHKIILALDQTLRLMVNIDDVIQEHGGWPDAFLSGSGTTSSNHGGQRPPPTAMPGIDQEEDEVCLEASTSAVVDETQREIAERMKALEPIVDEYERLKAAEEALGAVDSDESGI
jgi:type I restriction-modification system DNA methylase subunit